MRSLLPFRSPAVVALLVLTIRCEVPPADEAVAPTDAVDFEEVRQLRSLGYVGTAPALPPDAEVGVLLSDPARWQPGLNFFTNAQFCSAQLMDMSGEILHSWSYEPCFRWGNALLTLEGDLLVMGRKPYEENREASRLAHYLVRMDWSGELRWEKQIAAHHDVDVSPDGKILTLVYEHRLIPERHESVPVRDDKLVLLDSDGDLVEEQSMWDLLQGSPELLKVQRGRVRRFEGGREIDMFHTNTVEWLRYPELVGSHSTGRARSWFASATRAAW